jgi:hypothetical protein
MVVMYPRALRRKPWDTMLESIIADDRSRLFVAYIYAPQPRGTQAGAGVGDLKFDGSGGMRRGRPLNRDRQPGDLAGCGASESHGDSVLL